MRCSSSCASSYKQCSGISSFIIQSELHVFAVQVADSIGLPVDEGIFGFKPFPEVCNVLDSQRTIQVHVCLSGSHSIPLPCISTIL